MMEIIGGETVRFQQREDDNRLTRRCHGLSYRTRFAPDFTVLEEPVTVLN